MSTVSAIGRNLLRFREQRGLTLAGLSERSGVAKSTLSQLENGEGNPTIETLWAVANALGVPFGQLVNEELSDGGELSDKGVIVRLIEKSTDDPEIEVYLIELRPGCRKDSAPHPEGVKERITVLSGAMLVGQADRPRMVRAGDTHTFDADVPHVYAATEQGGRAMVVIVYPPKTYSASASTLYLEWPQAPSAWEGVRSVMERALLEVSNGLGARILRLRGEPLNRRDGLLKLRQMQHEATAGPWRWPVLSLVEDDAQGPYVAVVPMPLTGAFAQPDQAPPAWANADLPAAAIRLARLAESPFIELGAPETAAIQAHLEGRSWVLNSLAAEVLLQRGRMCMPRQLHHVRPAPAAAQRGGRDGPFSSRIDVEQYDAFELLHPAYARQVVAAAQDIASFAGPQPALQAIDVGAGPGLPLLMLHELHPGCRFLAVEPDEAAFVCLQRNAHGVEGIELHHGGFLELDLPSGETPLITSFGASHHFNTAFMLQKAMQLLQPGGLLVVADEFLPEFASVDERNLALVRHHSAYLLASMAWVGEPPASEGGLDLRLYRDLRRSIIMAMVAATEGKSNQAVSLCRNLYARLCESGLRERPAHEIGAFVRFYWLELQAMVAGFDYEVERKTFPRRFAGLAALAGLELRRHRRVFATTGSDDWGGGTHVFTFSKPEGA